MGQRGYVLIFVTLHVYFYQPHRNPLVSILPTFISPLGGQGSPLGKVSPQPLESSFTVPRIDSSLPHLCTALVRAGSWLVSVAVISTKRQQPVEERAISSYKSQVTVHHEGKPGAGTQGRNLKTGTKAEAMER